MSNAVFLRCVSLYEMSGQLGCWVYAHKSQIPTGVKNILLFFFQDPWVEWENLGWELWETGRVPVPADQELWHREAAGASRELPRAVRNTPERSGHWSGLWAARVCAIRCSCVSYWTMAGIWFFTRCGLRTDGKTAGCCFRHVYHLPESYKNLDKTQRITPISIPPWSDVQPLIWWH